MKRLALLVAALHLNAVTIEDIANDSKLWEVVDTQSAFFPKDFHFGIATSEYQYSGMTNCPNSQWVAFEKELVENGTWDEKKMSHEAHDHWNNVDEFVDQLVDLGVTSYRFSIEWSKIEPREGSFDKEAIKHYKHLIALLQSNNIEPMVTLHHFSEPKWFFDRGSFENEKNIPFFKRFCRAVFTELHNDVTLWTTINEPEVVAFQGYVMGEFPPAHGGDFALAGELLKNMLKAHCEVYRDLKKIDSRAQIGLVHDGIHFIPSHWWNPLETIPCHYLSHICHGAVLEFLKTGKFEYYIPFKAHVTFEEENIHDLIDWVGVNYYTRPLISIGFEQTVVVSTHREGEAMTTYQFREDPAGLYEILKETYEATGKPIYVTETGCPTNDDWQRCRYLERSRYTIAKSIEEGIPVKGMYAWSLRTNFEWGRGFGAVDFGLISRDGKIRPSYYHYQKAIQDWKDSH